LVVTMSTASGTAVTLDDSFMVSGVTYKASPQISLPPGSLIMTFTVGTTRKLCTLPSNTGSFSIIDQVADVDMANVAAPRLTYVVTQPNVKRTIVFSCSNLPSDSDENG
jgi:hypothetical protein